MIRATQALHFFPGKQSSKLVLFGAPTQEEQVEALVTSRYWTILNSHFFHCGATATDNDLRSRVNTFKHLMQVHGSDNEKLPDFRPNKGRARGHIFHGHVKDSQGTTFVIEWSVIDTINKQIAITRFDKHENFTFKQDPLTAQEIQAIVSDETNIRVVANVEKQREAAVKKCERMAENLPFRA